MRLTEDGMGIQIVPLIIVLAYLAGLLLIGHAAGTSTALLNIVSLFCLTASQILASGTVVSTLAGLPLNIAILISGAIVFGCAVGALSFCATVFIEKRMGVAAAPSPFPNT
jgi:hypothetical protein